MVGKRLLSQNRILRCPDDLTRYCLKVHSGVILNEGARPNCFNFVLFIGKVGFV